MSQYQRASMDGCIPTSRMQTGMLCLLLSLVCATASAVEPKPATQPPAKAAVCVATLDHIEANGTRRPVMEVWSNGQVNAVELTGTRQKPVMTTHSDRLSSSELRSLHQVLLGNCQLGTQTTDGLRQAIQTASEQEQLTADIQGAATTEIGILVGQEWRTVACPAVSILTTRFPQVTEIQNFATAQSRLQNIAAVALLGGAKAADQEAATATHKLREMHPEAGVITRRDLMMVRRLPNESRFVQFRSARSSGGDEGYLVNVTQSPEGPARVSVMDSPTVVR